MRIASRARNFQPSAGRTPMASPPTEIPPPANRREDSVPGTRVPAKRYRSVDQKYFEIITTKFWSAVSPAMASSMSVSLYLSVRSKSSKAYAPPSDQLV